MRLTRKFVIDTVIAKLALIRIANGYSCDIGQQVDYGDGIKSNPELDSVGVIDGVEVFGTVTRPRVRPRDLTVYLSAIFFENKPLERANVAAEDVLRWLDENPSFGFDGVRVTLNAITTTPDDAVQLVELAVTLTISYS